MLLEALATTTAGEVWGMTASVLTVLTLILGGIWKLTRVAINQVAATRDNTTAIAQLTRRVGRVEGAVADVPGQVATKLEDGD
jgi:flagellar biogenesis protein FliO